MNIITEEHKYAMDASFWLARMMTEMVNHEFPELVDSWPALQKFNGYVYLHDLYIIIVNKANVGLEKSAIPREAKLNMSDIPKIEHSTKSIEDLREYLTITMNLSIRDYAIFLPLKRTSSFTNDLNNLSEYLSIHLQYQLLSFANIYRKAIPEGNVVNNVNTSGTGNIVLVNSNDNVVSTENHNSAFFEQLKSVLPEIESDDERQKISLSIDKMSETHATPSFTNSYVEFMSFISAHVTIFAPFLPHLAAML